MIARLILSTTLLLIASLCRAARDAQSSADPRGSDRLSKRGPFWNYATSWANKYKPGTRKPRFPGATTWAVAVTDFWHLSQFVATCCQSAALLLFAVPLCGWWAVLVLVPGALAFEPAFKRFR